MAETVLITGGSGFIGTFTAADVLDAGHEPVLFDIDTDLRIARNLGIESDVSTVRGDVTDPTSVARAVRESGASRIVHLAALLTDSSRANPRAAIDVNVGGTNSVLEAARVFDDQVERVVWASSSAVYAPPDSYDSSVDEDDLVKPSTLYGAAKVYNERQAEVYREDYGVSHVGLRPTLVYGPYRETGSAAALVRVIEDPARGEAVEIGPGDHLFDWQYVTDVAQGFRKAAFAPEGALSRRVYNVCGSRATLREVADVVRELLPDADITVTDEGSNPWMHAMEMDAARADFGYEPEYDLRSGVREYVNVVREAEGLPAV